MTIIVTGAAGFIGANIVKALNERGQTDIIAVDNMKKADKFRNLVDCEIADYLDKEDFIELFLDGAFDGDVEAILHQGACSDTMETDGRYMMDNNYRYTLDLFEYCQTEEIPLLELVKSDRTHIRPAEGFDFRNLNSVLGEITNLVWGAFKNRYVATDRPPTSWALSQVPIIINHLHRYISFGSENPQLCFKYTVVDKSKKDTAPLVLYQKFVFNLSWSPDDFKENETSVEDLVSSGELDLF